MPRMVELEGEAIGELSTLIAKAFDRAELKFLLKVRLDFDLERELNTAAGDDQLAFELILALERRGIVVDFLRRVIEARPKRDDLRAAVERDCPEALQPAPDAKATANAVSPRASTRSKPNWTIPGCAIWLRHIVTNSCN